MPHVSSDYQKVFPPKAVVVQLGLIVAFIISFAPVSFSGSFTVFGPAIFVRKSGKTIVEISRFTVPNPKADYTLRITNSNITSAVVTINDEVFVRPNDFKKNIKVIDKPVTLLTNNKLEVELRSQPEGWITLQIISFDNDPPNITAMTDPLPNGAGWNNTNVTVSFDCSDSTSGISNCTAPVTVDKEGADQVFTGTAVDLSGNEATTSVTLNIDMTPPALSSIISPTPNPNGWNNTEVTVNFQATDVLSGIADISDPVSLTFEGDNQLISGTAKDHAANISNIDVNINIDKTPPTIDITSPSNGAIINDPEIIVTGTINETLSSIASVTCNEITAFVSDSTFTCSLTMAEGTNTILVQATDNAGNFRESGIEVNLQTGEEVAIRLALEYLATEGIVFDDTKWEIHVTEVNSTWAVVLKRLPLNENIIVLGDEHHVFVSKNSGEIVNVSHFQ